MALQIVAGYKVALELILATPLVVAGELVGQPGERKRRVLLV